MSGNNKGLRLEDLPPAFVLQLQEEEQLLAARHRAERSWTNRICGRLDKTDKWLRRRITRQTSVPGLWLIVTGMLIIWMLTKVCRMFGFLGRMWSAYIAHGEQWRERRRVLKEQELEREYERQAARSRTARRRRSGARRR